MPLAAAIQMSSGPDVADNLDRAERLVREAASAGAGLVVLPEVFHYRGPRKVEADAFEPIPGPTTERFGSLARELGIVLQAGSLLERIDDGRQSYNTATLFSASGELLACYRKIHLFDVDIPGQVTARESETRRPGESVVAVPTELGTIGLSICYDLRFPELYRALSRAGAEIVTVPSAFTFPTGAAHWETLLRARAIENQVWIVAPDQYGQSPYGHRDYGQSMIVDPWGAVVSRASEGEGIALGEIRPEVTAKIRRELPCLEHRRL